MRKKALTANELSRYSRQLSLKAIGKAGQSRLSASTVLVAGCGGLGCTSAGLLARAGVGRLVIVDGGTVELSNLHRQVLYGEEDIGRPKAMVAADQLQEVNPAVEIISVTGDIDGANIEGLLEGVDLLVDGTDNMTTRHVLNEACVKERIPWVYGGATGTTGMTMTIVPGRTPCLSCIFPDGVANGRSRAKGPVPVLNTLPSIIGALQATEVIKLVIGKAPREGLLVIDAWHWEARTVSTRMRKDCPTCRLRRFPHLGH
jgi:adenylyltransferase/sulfurtransferase